MERNKQKKKTMEINRNIEMSVDYRLTSLSSNALAAFVELGIMCPYVIPHISLSEESLAAQLQERIKCENRREKKKTDIEVQSQRERKTVR